MFEKSLHVTQKFLVALGYLWTTSEKFVWPWNTFWMILGNLRKVVGNPRKIVKNVVTSMCTYCIVKRKLHVHLETRNLSSNVELFRISSPL